MLISGIVRGLEEDEFKLAGLGIGVPDYWELKGSKLLVRQVDWGKMNRIWDEGVWWNLIWGEKVEYVIGIWFGEANVSMNKFGLEDQVF